jgi:hypothetical protein
LGSELNQKKKLKMSGKLSKDYINSFGKPPLSPYLSGETPTDTAAVAQSASAQLNRAIKGPLDETWAEPGTVTPSRSMNTVVFQSKTGGNSVVVNDEGSGEGGYMLITHNSGSVVQINANGTVLIKSFGDTHNNTEGIHYQHSKGDTKVNVGGSWDVRVDRGAHNLFVNGDINVECENYNVTARGKIVMNAGESIEMKGSRYSMEAHTDNLDLIAKNIKIATTESMTILSKKDIYLAAQEQLSLKSTGMTYMTANSDINVLTTGEGNLYIKTAKKMTTAVGDAYSLGVVETADISVAKDTAITVSGGTLDMKSSGVAKLDGSEVRLGETTDAAVVDTEEAAEAPEGAKAVTVTLSDPPARRPSDASNEGISAVQPTPDGITSDTIDDSE